MDAPGPIPNTSRAAQWLDRLRRFCLSLRILPGVGYRINRTTNGTILLLDAIGGGPGIAVAIDMVRITALFSDYVTADTFNGVDFGPPSVSVAKPPELRHTFLSEMVDGVTITYTFPLDDPKNNVWQDIRMANATGYGGIQPEKQVLVRRLTVGNLLYVATVNKNVGVLDGLGKPITRIDLNVTGRYWARAYNQQ